MPSRRLALLSLLLACAGVTLNAHAQQALDSIQKAKTVRIGVPADMPPFGYKAGDGQLRGLDIDMAQLIGTKLGAKVELVTVTSGERVPALQQHRVDLVISTLGRNPDREKLIDFANDYSSFYLAVFGPKAQAIAGPADLRGKTIAVTRGSIEDQELTKVAPADATVQRHDDNAASLAAYIGGKAQLLAGGISVAAAAVQTNPGLEADAKFVLKDSRNFIGVGKGEEALRNRVNQIVDEAKSSGELLALGRKWFSRNGLNQK
ncbi:transporter substrate-binding domain-containing protein [Aquincola sp. S2]|uniref:Transporter substrate-binding domain-containing protein n=1 Tax=Pseudaquabacterium terrae TaxID=2732868 RepID=A0ABX2EA63_9BURK|nr:transporter substrate-binding domain-containing protein [Aquabacterium terrae]NRF65945.1 transporter substrate-binding domain-containing protein [Aquabacterium terrae]